MCQFRTTQHTAKQLKVVSFPKRSTYPQVATFYEFVAMNDLTATCLYELKSPTRNYKHATNSGFKGRAWEWLGNSLYYVNPFSCSIIRILLTVITSPLL